MRILIDICSRYKVIKRIESSIVVVNYHMSDFLVSFQSMFHSLCWEFAASYIFP